MAVDVIFIKEKDFLTFLTGSGIFEGWAHDEPHNARLNNKDSNRTLDLIKSITSIK